MVKDDAMPNSFVAVLAREVGVALQGRILWAWRYKVELCGRGVKGRIINRFQRDLKKKFIVLTIY